MKQDRREFLIGAAKLGIAAGLAPLAMQGCNSSSGSGGGGQPAFVASGDVSQDSVCLWANPRTTGNVTFEVSTDADFTSIVDAQTVSIAAFDIPVKVAVTGLAPATQYYYRVTASGVTAFGRFRTAAALGTTAGLRFGVSGDWRGKLAPFPAIKNVPGEDLDFFVQHGDTIYADHPSPDLPLPQATTLEQLRIKHNEWLQERTGLNTFGQLRSSCPVFSTIDDHEVVDNFAGGADPAIDPRFSFTTESFINETTLYENGLQAFHDYNPINEEFYGATGDPRTSGKRKLYRFRLFGSDAAIFVLDGRSFRDAPIANPTSLDQAAITAFVTQAFNPARTMLGGEQLTDLLTDLATAHAAGVTWKFVFTPMPIQNLPPIDPGDRWDGYLAERSTILGFILQQGITNVVFVCADIHGTIVNNLSFVNPVVNPLQQIQVDAFEISTGPVAFDAPLGPQNVPGLLALGLITPAQAQGYASLSRIDDQDAFVTNILNGLNSALGFNTVGLDGSSLNATLEEGRWVRVHNFGWTKFEVDPTTQVLTVTTYGIPHYDEGGAASPAGYEPVVTQRFTVVPK